MPPGRAVGHERQRMEVPHLLDDVDLGRRSAVQLAIDNRWLTKLRFEL